jgi:hypothetical protein
MVEFGWEQNRLSASILKGPPRHSDNCRRHTPPGNFVGIAWIPGLGRGEARFASRIGEDFRRVTELLDLLDNSPFKPIEILR